MIIFHWFYQEEMKTGSKLQKLIKQKRNRRRKYQVGRLKFFKIIMGIEHIK